MPRPLHESDNRNPTITQNTFVPPVGADRCVGPLHPSRFRARAHTQVRPYKATTLGLQGRGMRLYAPAIAFRFSSGAAIRFHEAHTPWPPLARTSATLSRMVSGVISATPGTRTHSMPQ